MLANKSHVIHSCLAYYLTQKKKPPKSNDLAFHLIRNHWNCDQNRADFALVLLFVLICVLFFFFAVVEH